MAALHHAGLVERIENLAGFRVDDLGRGFIVVHAGGKRLHLLSHGLDVGQFLRRQLTGHGELRLREGDARGIGGLLQRKLGYNAAGFLALGQQALDIHGEVAHGAGGQGQQDRDQLTFPENEDAALVLAGLAAILAGAKLIERAAGAGAARIAHAGHAIVAAAVRGVVAAREPFAVVAEKRMVEQDHAREFLDHIGLAGHFAGNLEGLSASGRDGYTVKGDVHAAQFRGHGLSQIEVLERGIAVHGNHFIFAHMLCPFLSGCLADAHGRFFKYGYKAIQPAGQHIVVFCDLLLDEAGERIGVDRFGN